MVVFSGLKASPSPLPTFLPQFDKFLHLLIYFPFGFMIFYHPDYNWFKLALILILVFNLGLFIELKQTSITGRSFEWLDFASNSLGAIIGIISFVFIGKGGRNVKG